MKKTLLLFMLSLFSLHAFSQAKKIIKGTVKSNEQELLEGVNIAVIGQARTTITNASGAFSIEVTNPSTAKLRLTFVGYKPLEVAVGDSTSLNIILSSTGENLNEVAIVAFGSQKKTSITAAITTISAKDLKGPTSNLTNTLAGKIPGVIAFQRSGEPGQDNSNFFIRGIGTFGAGKQDPLIYVDGIEITPNDLARINTDNIDNFSILKDAAATALYGSRGANGVLLIKTKGGLQGPTRIGLRVENRISGNTKTYKLADNIQYMRLSNESILTRDPLGRTPYDPNKIDNTAAGRDPILYPNNNWVDLLIKDYTHNYAVNFDVSGGNDKANFFVSLTYDENNGLLKESKINNFSTNVRTRSYSLLSNITIKFTPSTKALISVRGVFDANNSPIGGGARIFSLASSSNPVAFPAVYPQSYLPYAQHPLFGSTLLPNSTNALYSNPFAQSVSGFQQYNRAQLIPKITIDQDLGGITKGLSANVMAYTQRDADFILSRGYSPFFYQATNVAGTTLLSLLNETTPGQPQIGSPPTEYLSYSPGAKNVSQAVYAEGIINYNRTFAEKHTFGIRSITTIRSSLTGNASTLQLSLPRRNLNFLGQANYAYKDKYIVDFAFGYNGSERFANGKRYGFFPAISAGWIISKEKFMEDSKVFTNLKLRGSYGIIGNDQIGSDADRFFYLSEVNLSDPSRGYTFGENYNFNRPGVTINRFSNPEISWERSKQTNIGLEVSLFNSLNLVFEVYKQNRTSVLLERTSIPSIVALQTTNASGVLAFPRANIGEASSKGIDFSLNYDKNIGKDFRVKIVGNFTYAASKVLFNEQPKFASSLSHLKRTGQPVNQLYGLVAERLFTDETEVRNSPTQNFGQYMAGDIKYRDINGDGIISSLDVVPIGLPSAPEIIYGFGPTLGFKQFDFSFFFQGSARSSFMINSGSNISGGNVSGISPFVTSGGSQSGLLDIIAKDHWSEDNRNPYAFWPRLSSTAITNNTQASSWWLRRGDFLRLKQIDIGYNLTESTSKKIGLSNVRIYLSALNIFTISSFKAWEVEMAGNGLGYPLQRVYSFGLKVGI